VEKIRHVLAVPLILVITLVLIVGSLQAFPATVLAHNGNPHLVRTFVGPDGKEIDELVFPVKPPTTKETTVKIPQPNISMGTNSLSGTVPTFDWSYGCSATSAAMLFGYYDLNGYSNMYTGLANGGNCPSTNSMWGKTTYPSGTVSECPLSATHEGVDGREIMGHVDDYWIDYNNAGPDPYIVNGWQEHTYGDGVGDFMGTNQAKYGNVDGGTTFYFYTDGSPFDAFYTIPSDSQDGGYGMKLFAQSKGYVVTAAFNQYIQGQGTNRLKGFTFANYEAEIDAGRPVLIQVSGHTMLGVGYNTTGNIVYVHDTWDYATHQMTWGGSYAGMKHYGVTVLRLATPVNPVAPIAAFSGSPTSGTAPLTVRFTDQSTNSPTSWAWDFDSNGTIDSNLQNPSYNYPTAGTYTVKLTASNTVGSDNEIKTSYITVNAPVAPLAVFTANPTIGTAPLTVNFTDQSTGSSPITYAWDFNTDGTVDSTEQNPSYTYNSAGTYTVTLTVTNSAGSDVGTKDSLITVNIAPSATINIISPNGGEIWNKGTSMNITWTSQNVSGNVKIELSRNSGSTWTTIVSNTANDGGYSWKVTRPATTQARIRISSVTNSVISDISNNDFTIR
jgi:PKD repeat protein